MTDFYTLAKQLRAALADLYPGGYVKTIRTETGVSTTIKNFSGKPITVIKLEMIGSDGTSTDLSDYVTSIEIKKG